MRTAIAEARAAFGLPDPAQAPGQETLLDIPTADAPAIVTGGGPEAPAMLVRGPWPVGIIGLVAGRLADETGRPTVVGTQLGDVIRASCRSDGRVNLAETLTACDDLFVRYGGHAAAAGFELPVERWDAFVERFLAAAAVSAPVDARPPLPVDLALPAAYVDYGLYRDLARLAPCGTGNPEPLVAVLGLTVQRVRLANGGHTQLVLRRDVDVLDGIAFGRCRPRRHARRGRSRRRRRAPCQPDVRRPRDAPARGPRRLGLGCPSARGGGARPRGGPDRGGARRARRRRCRPEGIA